MNLSEDGYLAFLISCKASHFGEMRMISINSYYELPDLALFQIKAAVTAIKDQMDRTFL